MISIPIMSTSDRLFPSLAKLRGMLVGRDNYGRAAVQRTGYLVRNEGLRIPRNAHFPLGEHQVITIFFFLKIKVFPQRHTNSSWSFQACSHAVHSGELGKN